MTTRIALIARIAATAAVLAAGTAGTAAAQSDRGFDLLLQRKVTTTVTAVTAARSIDEMAAATARNRWSRYGISPAVTIGTLNKLKVQRL